MVARLPGLRVGLTCQLETSDPLADAEPQRSRIEELQGDQVIVQWPTKRGQPIPMAIGSSVSLSVPTTDSDGRVSATLYLDCEVAQRFPPTRDEPIPTVGLRVLGVGREQRRRNFRLPLTIDLIDCAVFDRQFGQSAAAGDWRPIEATIIDLSSGGVGLNSHSEVMEGARVRLRFAYPMGGGEFAADGSVRGVQPLGSRHRLAVAFTNVNPQRRERLMRCIHRFQLEQVRRSKSTRAG